MKEINNCWDKKQGSSLDETGNVLWDFTEGGPLIESLGREHESRAAQAKAVDGDEVASFAAGGQQEGKIISLQWLSGETRRVIVWVLLRMRSLHFIPSAVGHHLKGYHWLRQSNLYSSEEPLNSFK